MLTREQIQELCNTALRASKADETEVAFGGGHLHLVRLAGGAVRESHGERWYEVRIRAHVGRRVGIARTDRLDAGSVKAAVARAVAAARAAPEVPGLLPFADPHPFPESTRFDPEVDTMPASARLAYVAPLVLDARRHGAQAAGLFAARAGSLGPGGVPGVMALANSRGLFAFHRTTRLRLDARVEAGAGSGWAEIEHWRARDFDPAPAVARALAKALAARVVKPLPKGPYEVILEPAAVAALLTSIAPHFSARAVDDGWSYLRGRQGRAITRGNITLTDEPDHPLLAGTPFDGEGMARHSVRLLWRGVVRDLVYSRAAARRHGVKPTGHAPLGGGAAVPRHLVLAGEDRSMAALIGSCQRGVLVTRFWNHHVLEPAHAITGGSTRDGTYWIEAGRVRHALPDLCYRVGAFDVLAKTTLLSRPEKALGSVVPAIKVRGFHFLGETR